MKRECILDRDTRSLIPASVFLLFLDPETERLLYTIIVHLCILDLVICSRID
jgi:hypothetical protein